MKKWMAAIGLVVLLLVGVMPANIRQAEAGRVDDNGTSASMFFKTVNIEDKTIAGGESATFSVRVLQDNVLEAVKDGTTILMGFKWDVKKNGINYTNDNSYSDMFTVTTVIDNQLDTYASILTINAVEGNCILDGATVTLTMITKNPSSGEPETITFTDKPKLTVSHTTGDWVLDEEASSGAIQVSNKTCIACGTVVDTKEEVAPLENPVYVGEQALQNAGDSVTGNSGTATLHIAQDGSPVLVLDNYVYTGSGYEYESGKFAGIYYAGTGDFYLIPGTEASGIASTNSITVTAENATYSYGIYLPSAKLHIGGSENGAADSLTVTGGPAKQYSAGIHVAGMYSYQSEQVQVITDPETLTEEPLNFGGNFTLNAAGGTVSGSYYTFSHGIWIKNETESMFSGGTINATGGQATANSGDSVYEGFSYGIRAESGTSVLFNGATVTARGGNNSEAVEGSTTRTSYGCKFSEFELSAGSLTAIGGDITGTDSSASRESYGLYGTGSITGGTLTATGGNTIKGWSYGIESKGLSVSGNAVVTANSNGTTDTRKIGIKISGNAGTMSVADNATVTASASDAGGIYAHYGLFMEGSPSTYTQTGGTVLLTAYSEDTGANNAGAYFSSGNKATISGGTFTGRATVKGIGATDLIINGGTVTGISEIHNDIKPAADATSYGISAYSLVLTDGELIGTSSDSYDYKWTTGIRIGYQSTISGGTVTGTGGNVYVGDSGYNSIQSVGVEFVALNMSAGTVTGNAGAVDKPQNNYSIGVNITDSSTVSGTAKINGTGLTAGVNCSNGTITVSGDAAITGTGKTGIDLKYLSMPAEENNAVVTGISNASENGTGIYLIGKGDNESVLAGGKLNATAPETGNNHIGLRSLGTITTTGTLITAKGGSKAMEIEGNSASKNIVVADVVVVSETYSGTGKKALSIGGHTSEELASYRYAEAGNRSELGFEPTKRSLSEAVITLTETLTYNGSEQTQGFTVNVAEVELTAGEHFTVTGEKATDAGTYTLILTAKPDTDYTGTATMEYTVGRWDIGDEATVTVTGGPYAYQSTVDPAAVIVKHGETELVYEKDYTICSIWTGSVGENQGNVMVQSMESSNYYWNSTVKGTFTVVRAENPVVVEPTATVIRGGNKISLYNNYSQHVNAPSYTIKEPALGCTVADNGAFTSGNETGEVTVILTFPETTNYNGITKEITVTITDKNRAELANVNIADTDYQYNDATNLAQVYYSGSGSRVKEDIIEYSGTTRSGATYARSTTPPTQAGNYTVHVTYETKDTIYTGSDDFVINPKYIASNITVTLGEALTYNGTEQTQTVTEVRDANADYTFNETEYTITGNKQTNAGYYRLDITGIGNFTGTKTVSYEIAKATPTLGDFEIPDYDDTVDYTGEYIEITPPTSTKNGMGNTYIETYVRNAGTYNITFKVYEGTNYTAASGFTYGTITVNKVYHNISTTNALVGINGKMIDLNERVTGEENIGATFTIIGDDLGCTINGRTFFSGSVAGEVTVQVTVPGDENYLETIGTFTVEVVEVGGVKVWGGVTSSGSSSDENTIQLLQGGEVKYEKTILGNSIEYSFDSVAAGTYTLRVSKANHITAETEVIVASEDVHVETVELKLYKFGQTVQIRLIEPWGLKANVRVHDGVVNYIDYSELYNYGVYFIRKSDLDVEGATQDTLTIDDIVGDSDATHMSKGNGVTVEGSVLTATYDKKLYTYQFSDSVFVMFYIIPFEGASPIYAPIRERNLSALICAGKDDNSLSLKERNVYISMNQLETDILSYRADFENPSVPPEQNAPTLSETPLSGAIANTGKYFFGHTVQIRLVEPWGLKVNARVYTQGMTSGESINYEELIDYGVIMVVDNNASITTAEEFLARPDAYIFSKANGEAQVSGNVITATFSKGIYTYLLDSNVYVMFYVKDADGYHFGAVKERNVYNLMNAGRNDAAILAKEKALYNDMVNLYEVVTTYRADYIE